MDPAALTHLQIDALREVTQIGCGAAATALAQLLGGRRVGMTVTEARVQPRGALRARLSALGPRLTGVRLALRGGAEGELLLAWEKADAERLSALLAASEMVGAESDTGQPDLSDSALMEVGNIVASAYLNAVAKVTGLMLLPSVPELVHGDAETLAQSLAIAPDSPGEMLLLETWLEVEGDAPTCGHVLIVSDAGSLDVLLGTLGL